MDWHNSFERHRLADLICAYFALATGQYLLNNSATVFLLSHKWQATFSNGKWMERSAFDWLEVGQHFSPTQIPKNTKNSNFSINAQPDPC